MKYLKNVHKIYLWEFRGKKEILSFGSYDFQWQRKNTEGALKVSSIHKNNYVSR